MHILLTRILCFICIGMPLHAAIAQTTDDDMCRNGLFPSELAEMRLATFAGEKDSRLYFFSDMDGCPAAGPQCRTSKYVVPGDELIVSKRRGAFRCAWYPGKAHETVGWVPDSELTLVETERHPAWTGTWKQYAYPGYISIARKADAYYVLGNMKWIGARLENGTRVEHLGDMGGALAIQDNRAHIGPENAAPNPDDACAADFTRLGKYLIVHDNTHCGGMNVRFDGVYTMAPPRK